MPILGQQRFDVATWLVLAAMAFGIAALSIVVPVLMPWGFLGLAGAALLLLWVVKGDITLWAWFWALSYGLLDSPTWKVPIPGFFTMSVPRFIFLAAVLAFFLYFLARGRGIRFDRALLWSMLALLGYFAISASVTGWTASTPTMETAPYYRFLEPLLLPLIIFLMVYSTVRDEGNIRWALVLLTLYGWYALYIGYLQFAAIAGAAGARAYIWPAYINDPNFGIHFERARGAFPGAAPQAMLMVLLFYVDLYLIRKTRGAYRTLLMIQAVLVLGGLFFTGIRSGYVAWLLCGFLWLMWGDRGRFGLAKLGLGVIAVAAGGLALWPNLAQTNRLTGGVAQQEPLVSREVLAHQTWEIVKEHPIFGVGFGHFVDAQQQLARDPNSILGMSRGVMVEHNLFFAIAAETGVVGLALLLAVLILVLRQSFQLYRKIPPDATGLLSREFVVVFWVAMVNLFSTAMFRDILWEPFTNAIFWSLAAMVVGFNRILEDNPLRPTSRAVAVEKL